MKLIAVTSHDNYLESVLSPFCELVQVYFYIIIIYIIILFTYFKISTLLFYFGGYYGIIFK
jgi:hypothetical protein